MPSSYTPNYQLSQWEPGDQVLREDFNEDNATIDGVLQELGTTLAARGNGCLWFGSYTGTGTYGKTAPITLTFPKRPLVVLIFNEPYLVAVRGCTENTLLNSGFNNHANWSEMGVTSYSSENARANMNIEGQVYYYCAFLEV